MDVLATFKRLAPTALSLTLVLSCTAALPPAAFAQQASAAAGSITGTVTSADGSPVGGAAISLQGPAPQRTASDAKGHFAFASVVPGTYTIVVTKSGFSTTQQEDVYVVAGSAASVSATLAQSSFSSLRQIGRVSTNVPGRATINTAPAAVTVISNQAFADQAQLQVTKILN
jgi:hypothetical protein